MPFHLVAFNADVGTTANTQVAALTDDVITRTNSNFLPQQDLDLIFAAAMSANINRCRITSPSNRQITLPFIRPIIAAATPPADPGVADYHENPFRVRGLEELGAEGTTDLCMGTESFTVLYGLQTIREPVPAGNVFTLRGTSTTASVADTWTTITMTWADTLPEGSYAAVGLNVIGATQVAARIIFEDQTWRPGCLATAAVGNRTHELFRKGRLGVWGRFRSTAMPQIQVLNTAAVSVHTAFLDLIRIS